MKTFDEMTYEEQNAVMEIEWAKERAKPPVVVTMPAETTREGYYHESPSWQ